MSTSKVPPFNTKLPVPAALRRPPPPVDSNHALPLASRFNVVTVAVVPATLSIGHVFVRVNVVIVQAASIFNP